MTDLGPVKADQEGKAWEQAERLWVQKNRQHLLVAGQLGMDSQTLKFWSLSSTASDQRLGPL